MAVPLRTMRAPDLVNPDRRRGDRVASHGAFLVMLVVTSLPSDPAPPGGHPYKEGGRARGIQSFRGRSPTFRGRSRVGG
jgi:hypothetical protein